MAFNLVILTGRLARDPELKYGASGSAYTRFTIAVNRMKKEDGADFISCTAFGKTAELIAEYTRKGNLIGVQGRLQQDTYEKDGQKQSKTGVTVDKIEFMENNKEEKTEVAPNKSNKVNPKPDLNLGKSKESIIPEIDITDDFPF